VFPNQRWKFSNRLSIPAAAAISCAVSYQMSLINYQDWPPALICFDFVPAGGRACPKTDGGKNPDSFCIWRFDGSDVFINVNEEVS